MKRLRIFWKLVRAAWEVSARRATGLCLCPDSCVVRALALLLAVAAVGCYAPEAPPVPVVFTSLAPDWELLDETHLRCEDQVLAPELDSVSCVWRCAIWQGLPRRVEVRFDVDMHPLEEGTEGPAVGALYFTGASDVDVGDCG